MPVRVIPLPRAGASWRVAPLAASRLPPVQLQLMLWIDKRAARNVDGAAVYGGEGGKRGRAAARHFDGAFVGKRADARHSARAADVVSRSGLVVEGPAAERKVAGARLVHLALVDEVVDNAPREMVAGIVQREKAGVGERAPRFGDDRAALPLEKALGEVEGRPGGADRQ